MQYHGRHCHAQKGREHGFASEHAQKLAMHAHLANVIGGRRRCAAQPKGDMGKVREQQLAALGRQPFEATRFVEDNPCQR